MTEKIQAEGSEDGIYKLEEIGNAIAQEIACLQFDNVDRNASGKLKYQCRYIFDHQRLDVFSGEDFLYGGCLHDFVRYEDAGLQERDIHPHDIFIKAGNFASLVKEYLMENNVNIGQKFWEANTYSQTSKLGVRVLPAATSKNNSSSSSNTGNKSIPRHKFYVKFRESLGYLMSNIKRVASESAMALRLKDPLLLSSFARSVNLGSRGSDLAGMSAEPPAPPLVAPLSLNEEYMMDLIQNLYERVERLETEVVALHKAKVTPAPPDTVLPSADEPPLKKANRRKN